MDMSIFLLSARHTNYCSPVPFYDGKGHMLMKQSHLNYEKYTVARRKVTVKRTWHLEGRGKRSLVTWITKPKKQGIAHDRGNNTHFTHNHGTTV